LYRYFVSQSSEFAAITLCVASQRVFVVVVVYFVIDSVRKLLDTRLYGNGSMSTLHCPFRRWLWGRNRLEPNAWKPEEKVADFSFSEVFLCTRRFGKLSPLPSSLSFYHF